MGTETVVSLRARPAAQPGPDELGEALRPDILRVLHRAARPMFMVPYHPIRDDVVRQIIRLQLGRVAARMRENHEATLSYGEDLVATVAARCREVERGARNVDHILTRSLLPEISREFLARIAEGRAVSGASVAIGEGGEFRYMIC